jgi:outer membrane protein OmpA-like peptidoglycan-associated protein
MRRARSLAIPVLLVVGALTPACGPKRFATPPAPPAPALVVLLPDADGKVGRVRVSNEFGFADLSGERQAVNAAADRRPATIRAMSETEVNRLFGSAIAALPAPPRYFTLYFQFESDRLTPQSRALLPEILKTVRDRSMPEVTVVGHTDTMGSAQANIQLGLKRASTVRNILVDAGLDPALIEVTSHGEADLLMRTPDGTPKLHNRRVEISVR